MTNIIAIAGASGGTGTSTLAALIACQIANDGNTAAIIASHQDIDSILGNSNGRISTYIRSDFNYADLLGRHDTIILDLGSINPSIPAALPQHDKLILTINNSYPTLKNALLLSHQYRFDYIYALIDPQRPLGEIDLHDTLIKGQDHKPKLHCNRFDSGLARAIDAGILCLAARDFNKPHYLKAYAGPRRQPATI
jgi:cellulose biosynthesis protein BcsQ